MDSAWRSSEAVSTTQVEEAAAFSGYIYLLIR
jgi:hypothetical protein